MSLYLFVRAYDNGKRCKNKIEYTVKANELYMRQDKVISLALITTELLLNSIKYVANHKACKISISLSIQNEMIAYQYTDNGSGLAPTFNIERVTTTGLMLVKQLSKQLNKEDLPALTEPIKVILTPSFMYCCLG